MFYVLNPTVWQLSAHHGSYSRGRRKPTGQLRPPNVYKPYVIPIVCATSNYRQAITGSRVAPSFSCILCAWVVFARDCTPLCHPIHTDRNLLQDERYVLIFVLSLLYRSSTFSNYSKFTHRPVDLQKVNLYDETKRVKSFTRKRVSVYLNLTFEVYKCVGGYVVPICHLYRMTYLLSC